MKKEEIMKKNVFNTLFGFFFVSLSGIFVIFFLPFYLKEEGLSILQIGAIFTIGIAVGSLIFGLIFSYLQRKISLKNGLYFAGIFYFFSSFLFFLFPSSGGSFATKLSGRIGKLTKEISADVALQHNSSKINRRLVSALHLIVDSGAFIVGLAISILLIPLIGFIWSFFIFSLFALPSFYFYSKVKDNARFSSKKKFKDLKLGKTLNLLSFAELIYWFAAGASFALVITFLVTDYFSSSFNWIAYLYGALCLSIFISTLITKKHLDKMNKYKSTIIGMVILLLGVLIIIISKNVYTVLFAMILEGIGAGIWGPSKTALYWENTSPEAREKAAGRLFGTRNFLSALGPLFGGFLVVSFGIFYPFYFKIFAILIAIGIYIYLWKKQITR